MKCLLVSIFQTLRYLTTLPLCFFLVNRGFLLTVVAVILIACIFHMGTAMILKVSTNLSYFFFFFQKRGRRKIPTYKEDSCLPDWNKKLHVSLCNQRFPV